MAEAGTKYNQNSDSAAELIASELLAEPWALLARAGSRPGAAAVWESWRTPASFAPHLGASTITTCRPSKRGSCSTLASLDVSSLTRLRS